MRNLRLRLLFETSSEIPIDQEIFEMVSDFVGQNGSTRLIPYDPPRD
jgi:hypothetical protein